MKTLKKKGPIIIAAIFVAGALTYSVGYNVAMSKFNRIIAYNQEKEQMYYKLSEIDRTVRQDYIGDIDEHELMSGLSLGYIDGLNNPSCKYFTEEEYKKYISKKSYNQDAVLYQELDDGIGYIKIRTITPEVGNMFSNAVKYLFERNVRKIVVDTRNLYGSDLNPIAKCLDSIVGEGDTISTIDKKGDKEVVYKTISDGLDIKFSVIVNNSTSGTPELIASALKDSERGMVVGEKTVGNVVQEKTIPLYDGCGIVFPVAHYVTKSGQILTNNGVIPDVEVSLSEEKRQLLDRDELLYENDEQLTEAISCLNK